jgi:hypothetical protein
LVERATMDLSKSLFKFVVIAITLSGCATTQEIKDVAAPAKDRSVVFGQVEVYEDNEATKWGMTWSGQQEFRLLIIPPDSNTASVYRLREDGRFYWGLIPGEYTILGYDFTKSTILDMTLGGGTKRFRRDRLWLKFTVPPETRSLYIGDLAIVTDRDRYSVQTKDDYEEAVEAYRTEFPDAKDVPVKMLLTAQQKLGVYEQVTDICADDWGLECRRMHRGVMPTYPEFVGSRSLRLDTLTPNLKWKGSSDPDVTYDIAIHQVAMYTTAGIGKQYMRAEQVVYAENLKHPSFQVRSPLKPDTRYFWSVRLRRGKTVSNWSSFHYTKFRFSGHGHWFSFFTPE